MGFINKEGLFILWTLLLNYLFNTLNNNNRYASISQEIHFITRNITSDSLKSLH